MDTVWLTSVCGRVVACNFVTDIRVYVVVDNYELPAHLPSVPRYNPRSLLLSRRGQTAGSHRARIRLFARLQNTKEIQLKARNWAPALSTSTSDNNN